METDYAISKRQTREIDHSEDEFVSPWETSLEKVDLTYLIICIFPFVTVYWQDTKIKKNENINHLEVCRPGLKSLAT